MGFVGDERETVPKRIQAMQRKLQSMRCWKYTGTRYMYSPICNVVFVPVAPIVLFI